MYKIRVNNNIYKLNYFGLIKSIKDSTLAIKDKNELGTIILKKTILKNIINLFAIIPFIIIYITELLNINNNYIIAACLTLMVGSIAMSVILDKKKKSKNLSIYDENPIIQYINEKYNLDIMIIDNNF